MMITVNGKAMNDRPSIVDASIVDDSSLECNQKTFPVSLNREDEHDRVIRDAYDSVTVHISY